eukprot:gene12879-27536_t
MCRTTPPGHWGCAKHRFDVPIPTIGAARRRVWKRPTYSWETFEAQNEWLRGACVSHSAAMVDVEPMSLQRWDQHGEEHDADCLHYCQPGIFSEWARLAYTILVRQRRKLPDNFGGTPAPVKLTSALCAALVKRPPHPLMGAPCAGNLVPHDDIDAEQEEEDEGEDEEGEEGEEE